MFADDVKTFTKMENIDDFIRLQSDINTIQHWCSQNGLQLNKQKCYILSFTRKRQYDEFDYKIGNTSISRVTTIKDLGLIFDSKLSFESHCNKMVKKAYKMIGFLFRSLSKFKNYETYKLLYFTYVRSGLEYCTPVWNPHYNVYIDSIERVQRYFTRALFKKFRFVPEKNYLMRYVRLEILSLEDRRTINDELTLYKMYTRKVTTDLTDSLRLRNQIRFTRNDNMFYLPFVTTNVEYFSPMLRLQRNHDLKFKCVDLNEQCLATVKRYITYEIKSQQLIFNYSFE